MKPAEDACKRQGGTQYLVFKDFQSKRLGEEGIQLALL